MQLIALKNHYAIYLTDMNQIIALPIEQEAQQVLDWNIRHIPANDK